MSRLPDIFESIEQSIRDARLFPLETRVSMLERELLVLAKYVAGLTPTAPAPTNTEKPE